MWPIQTIGRNQKTLRLRKYRWKIQRILPIHKEILWINRYPKQSSSKKKKNQTLEIRTPAWLDSIKFVTHGTREDHEKMIRCT